MQTQRTTDDWERVLGAQVRETRMRAEHTQSELATRANVSLSSLRNLELGRGSTIGTVVRVARALGREEWLEAFSPPMPAISPMAVLRQRRREESRQRRRVRHRRAEPSPGVPDEPAPGEP